MRIKLKLNETSNVELIPCDECKAIQGEENVTVLEIEYPETIKDYPINNYIKYIEFAECKEFGPCAKFSDEITSNEYELKEPATSFRKLRAQFVFKNIVDELGKTVIWKSKVFELEFGEAINAEGSSEIQSQLLSLKEIKDGWEDYVTNNCFTVVYDINNMLTIDENDLNRMVFYLGVNSTDPYILTYGHYYRCTSETIDGVTIYKWTDLTQDPSLADVANGIREINNSQTVQLWLGDEEEIDPSSIQDNTVYLAENGDLKPIINDTLNEMSEDENYSLVLLRKEDENVKNNDNIMSQKKLLWTGNVRPTSDDPINLSSFGLKEGDKLQFDIYWPNANGQNTFYGYKSETLIIYSQYYDQLLAGVGWGSGAKLYGATYKLTTNLFYFFNVQTIDFSSGETVINTIAASENAPYIRAIYKVIE